MRRSKLLVVTTVSLTALLVGCGSGDEAPANAESSTAATSPAATAPAGTATIAGTVSFSGTAPERPVVNLDRECSDLHTQPVQSEHVVVNDNGTLKYVFVYVKEGLEGHTFPTPSEPVVLNQEGCMYEPHVFGVQTGQTIRILNSDPLLHNIHALPEDNRPFNFGMPTAGTEREQSFREPEVMVRIKCDVHGWMESFAGVLPHPYYSVTGDGGTFSLQNLPAGQYVIEAWHEDYGTQTQSVQVGDGESKELTFTFGETPAAA